jgi:GNAT superfamily N-acetyltransferase
VTIQGTESLPFVVCLSAAADSDTRITVEAGLAKHAQIAGAPFREVTPLCAFARDEASALIARLIGRTVWGWLHISELWVAEAHRRAGHGGRLMAAAEAEAMQRGCHGAYLDSFDFQAVPFYQWCGYSVFGKLEGFPPGHTRYLLEKQLRRTKRA